MHETLSELLSGAIDFLPSEGDLGEALNEYLKAKNGPLAEMLSRPRIPIRGLKDFGNLLEGAADRREFSLCAFSEESESWNDVRFEDAKWLNDFQNRFEDAPEVGMVSFAIPTTGSIQTHLDSLKGFSSADVEIVVSAERGDGEELIALAAEREWLEIGLYGSVDTLALRIVQCVGLEVPFRILSTGSTAFTSGSSIGVINAIAAAVFAYTEELSPKQVGEILEAGPADWRISAGEIRFQELTIDQDQIEEARSVIAGVAVRSLGELLESIGEIR